MVRYARHLILVAGALLAAQPILAADIDGQVLDEVAAPITGAMVTLTRADGLYSETVYSNYKGQFHIETALDGKLMLRARAPRFADATQTVDLSAKGAAKAEFKMRR